MDPIELGISIAPEDLLGAMVEQYSVEDITTFVRSEERRVGKE